MCEYRSASGQRCAVGVLITDEFYDESMEGKVVSDTSMLFTLSEALPGVDLGLLKTMQTIHDKVDPIYWEENWEKAASRYGLAVPTTQEQEVPCALPGTSKQ